MIEIAETNGRFYACEDGRIFDKGTGSYKVLSQLNTGYLSVHFNRKNRSVHRVIAKAFIPNPENKPCVNHMDGNKANNRVENLEWVTYSENAKHALDTKLKLPTRGERSNLSVLNEEKVLYIVSQLDTKTYAAIAKEVSVSIGALHEIAYGRNWSWLTGIKDTPDNPYRRRVKQKLTLEQIINIKHCKGSIGPSALGRLYSVTSPYISNIWAGRATQLRKLI